MAFGKDPRVLETVQSFRAEARNFEKERARNSGGTGGGARPTWIDQFKPSIDGTDKIRLLRGQYEVEYGDSNGQVLKRVQSFYPFIQHYHATREKYSICSAGPLANFKGKADPCRGCTQFWDEKMANKGTKKSGAMSRRDMYSFSILHYAPYAYVEQVDRDGKVRTNENGEPYMSWVRVFPHEMSKFAGREMREAHLLHWDMGYAHYSTLLEYDEEIGRSCRSCGGRNSIQLEAWTCTACGEALIERNTTYSPKEVKDLTSGEVRCAHCQHVGMLQEYVSCTQCKNGLRADIFDVDIEIKRKSDAQRGGNATQLIITSWSDPHPIDQRFTDIAKPMDLPKIFRPTPMEKQEDLFGPWASQSAGRQPVTVGSMSRPYNK